MNNFGKILGRIALCAAMICPVAVSCDWAGMREDIENLKDRVMALEERMNGEFQALADLINGSLVITEVKVEEGSHITTVTLSDGTVLQLCAKDELMSYVTYITSSGVDYWAYLDENGKRKPFLDENGEKIPVASETPEVFTRDGDVYLVLGGTEYPLSGNSVFSDYELVTDLEGNIYAVTFTFGEDMSFTVAVDGAASFLFVQNEGWSQVEIDDYFVAAGMTASVQYQAYGVVNFIVETPDGWKYREYNDPYLGTGFNITAPSAELIASGAAVSEGKLKVVPVFEGGKATVVELYLTTNPFRTFSGVFGKANIEKNNGLSKYAYGVCEESLFDEDVMFAQALENMDAYDYPAGYGMEFDDLVDLPLKEITKSDLTPGSKYILWALPAYYDEETYEYFLKEGTFVKEVVAYYPLTMEIVSTSARDAIIDIELVGPESYYFGLEKKEFFNIDYVVADLNAGLFTPKTELVYNASVFSFADVVSAFGTEYVAWMAVAGEGQSYRTSDIALCEFSTTRLQPGSEVEVEVELNSLPFDVIATLTSEGADEIYYSFMTISEASKYADTSDLAEYLFDNGTGASAADAIEVHATDYLTGLKPETDVVLTAVATDADGKYGKVIREVCSTSELMYNDLVLTVTEELNSPEEMQLKVTVTGGEALEYLYWIGKTTENTWKSSNYLGGKASTAQEYMYFNSTKSFFVNTAKKYPVGEDGIISMTDHIPGLQYVIVIMAKDETGLYSRAAELKFDTHAVNIGTVVPKTDSKWAAAEPKIEWLTDRFVPQIGMMSGSYAFNLTLPTGYTAYVLTATDAYFTAGDDQAESLNTTEKILAVIDWSDDPRDSERVTDPELYEAVGYPYGHEFFHFEHGDPAFGNAVFWKDQETHDKVCNCKEYEETRYYTGTNKEGEEVKIPYIQKHVLTFNDGTVKEITQSAAIGNKDKVVDRVFIVLQDGDGNCYETYEWDVPFEYFANAK